MKLNPHILFYSSQNSFKTAVIIPILQIMKLRLRGVTHLKSCSRKEEMKFDLVFFFFSLQNLSEIRSREAGIIVPTEVMEPSPGLLWHMETRQFGGRI